MKALRRRRPAWRARLLLTSLTSIMTLAAAATAPDPYLWLEEVEGERALTWVRERNRLARAELEAEPGFDALRAGLRAILDSRQQIPDVVRRGAHLYNLWRDADQPRGLWRRTTLDSYRRSEPEWEILIDLDALAANEDENWVWAGASCLGPAYRRCLVELSRGGADAAVVREFDLAARRFVGDGFTLPQAKSSLAWIDADTVYVGTDFGPGSMTRSGYPRVIKRWSRGQPLAEAVTVFEGQADDVSAWVSVDRTPGHERTLFGRQLDFYRQLVFLLDGKRLRPLAKPDDATLSFWHDQALLELRSDLVDGDRRWPRGSLLVAEAADLVAGTARWQPLFTPTATRSLAGVDTSRRQLLLEILDNVASRVEAWARTDAGRWQGHELATPFPGSSSVMALHDPLLADDPLAEAWLLRYADFLTPDRLLLGDTGRDELELLKSRPSFFDSQGMRVEQHHARSADGTQVPYFVVWPRGAAAGGRPRPTLLYGYGGFEVALQPSYSGTVGRAWLARGGVHVVANIRGGGEFGPGWHQAAVGAHRQRAFDDFAAVAEDLIRRGVSEPARLGIMGGSNGGLLVGAVMLQRPELFGAVVCQVPLLDMQRYHRLLAGASWMAEYGDPDQPAERAWLDAYSPYQRVRAGTRLAPVLFTTSTRDDRVHPGHARKMAARMIEQGHRVLYYENIEGGHGGAADNAQRAELLALEYSFLWRELGGGLPREP